MHAIRTRRVGKSIACPQFTPMRGTNDHSRHTTCWRRKRLPMAIENPTKHPRLRLMVPAQWGVRQLGPNLTEIDVDPDVVIQVRAMVVPTLDERMWIEGLMLEHMPPGSRLERIVYQAQQSTRGWPVVFAHYAIFDETGAPLEERAGAF